MLCKNYSTHQAHIYWQSYSYYDSSILRTDLFVVPSETELLMLRWNKLLASFPAFFGANNQFAYMLKKNYTVVWRYEFYFLMVLTIFCTFAAVVHNICHSYSFNVHEYLLYCESFYFLPKRNKHSGNNSEGKT